MVAFYRQLHGENTKIKVGNPSKLVWSLQSPWSCIQGFLVVEMSFLGRWRGILEFPPSPCNLPHWSCCMGRRRNGWNVALPTRMNSNRGWEKGHLDPRAPLRESGWVPLGQGSQRGRTGMGWAASLRKLRNFLRVCFSRPPLTRVSLLDDLSDLLGGYLGWSGQLMIRPSENYEKFTKIHKNSQKWIPLVGSSVSVLLLLDLACLDALIDLLGGYWGWCSQLLIRPSDNYKKITINLEKSKKWNPQVGSHFTLLKTGKITKMPLLGRVGPTTLKCGRCWCWACVIHPEP